MRPDRRKVVDAQRQRLKAREMLRLAHQTTMPEVAGELVEMARLLHESAQKAEAEVAPPPSPRGEKVDGA